MTDARLAQQVVEVALFDSDSVVHLAQQLVEVAITGTTSDARLAQQLIEVAVITSNAQSIVANKSTFINGLSSLVASSNAYIVGHIPVEASAQPSFIFGINSDIGSQLAHLIGTYNTIEEFTKMIYIFGINTSQNNEGSSWGPAIDEVNGIVNEYAPKNAYVVHNIFSTTASKLAHIVRREIILRAPTEEPLTNSVIQDISLVGNDGYTINNPTRIAGPH